MKIGLTLPFCIQELEEMEQTVWECLCRLETFIPTHYMTLAIHNCGHFARQIINFGPVRETWAFGAESKLGMMKRRAFNRYLPGATIMHRQVYEDSLRIIARISYFDPVGLDRLEENSIINTSGVVALYGSKKSTMFTAVDSLRHSIMEHIENKWPESKEILEQLAPGEEYSCLWEVLRKTGYQDKCLFVGRKKSIAGVWPKKACNYKTFRINGVAYETYENARRKSRTDNSNIVYKPDDTVEEFQAGRIESVLEVQVSHS